MTNPPMLEMQDLRVAFHIGDTDLHAVRSVSLTIASGEVVGVVGESGSGKSVAMMSITRLIDSARATISARALRVSGKDVLGMSDRTLEDFRGKMVSYIFQDPLTSLNPVLTVGYQIREVLRRHAGLSRRDAGLRAIELLAQVGISAPEIRVRQFPHQLSGGMRQRAMIAMALAAQPRLLIADEPTTALDVTVQAEIVNLVKRLQAQHRMAMVWVTHDLALLARIAHRVVVMYAGRIVEDAPAELLYAAPAHPYTAALLASTSRMDQPFGTQEPIPGGPPNPFEVITGCAFSPRCSRATERCRSEAPTLDSAGSARLAACFYPLHERDQ
jgi:oligopeptide/dipeptide ABC transporter ATP-binding protein